MKRLELSGSTVIVVNGVVDVDPSPQLIFASKLPTTDSGLASTKAPTAPLKATPSATVSALAVTVTTALDTVAVSDTVRVGAVPWPIVTLTVKAPLVA